MASRWREGAGQVREVRTINTVDPTVSLGLMHTRLSSVSCDKLIVLQRRK